jgi:hypothetical protein
MARTDTLPHFLTDVADAIRTKAGTSDPIQASSFDTAISNIPSGGVDFSYLFAETNIDMMEFSPNGQSLSIINMEGAFYGCSNLLSCAISGSNLDFSNCENFSMTFQDCTSLGEIPYDVDYSGATTMESMCNGCTSLNSFYLDTTSSLTEANYMFQNCESLDTVYSPDDAEAQGVEYNIIDTSSLQYAVAMFNGCTGLMNVSQLDTSNMLDMNSMFAGCYALTEQSLDNILGMCAGVSADYEDTKTLSAIGIQTADYPNTDFTSLTNYQDFIDAGWTLS